jgi:hypothetical protein
MGLELASAKNLAVLYGRHCRKPISQIRAQKLKFPG